MRCGAAGCLLFDLLFSAIPADGFGRGQIDGGDGGLDDAGCSTLGDWGGALVERGAEAGIAEDQAALAVGERDAQMGHELGTRQAGLKVEVHEVPLGAWVGDLAGAKLGLGSSHQGIREG
jgi:hypothetical protein